MNNSVKIILGVSAVCATLFIVYQQTVYPNFKLDTVNKTYTFGGVENSYANGEGDVGTRSFIRFILGTNWMLKVSSDDEGYKNFDLYKNGLFRTQYARIKIG